jgi:hypothetical protein
MQKQREKSEREKKSGREKAKVRSRLDWYGLSHALCWRHEATVRWAANNLNDSLGYSC